MPDFYHNNKVSGIRYLKNIENIIIKVTLKPKDNITSLPKFEEFNNSNEVSDVTSQPNQGIEEFSFKWQEKVLNPQELDYYSNKQNCTKEHEQLYYELTKNDPKLSKLFTYINEDSFKTRPFETAPEKFEDIDGLESCFKNLRIRNSKSTRDLTDNNFGNGSDNWISMHVMFDNSVYNEELQVMLKQETVLISIYWNQSTGCLVLQPDVNTLEWNPYQVESSSGVPWNYEYAADLQFQGEADDEEFRNLVRKLQKTWEQRHRPLKEFQTPPIGKYQYHVAIEILTAEDFNYGDLYIEYTIKIPDSMACKSTLKGRTNLAEYTLIDDKYVWNFSHILDLELENPKKKVTPKIHLYLEIISRDWWGSLRTEGYCYCFLPLDPGREDQRLLSIRPDESDRLTAEDRRFFIGGCHLLEDLDVLSNPQEVMNPNFKFTATGSVYLRYQILKQAPRFRASSEPNLPGVSSSSALLSGADAVLRQYKRARARLAAATAGFQSGDG